MKTAKNIFYKIALVLVGVLCYHLGAMAQTITGTVTDQENNPLTGVTIVEKGTTNGTITEMDGSYSITVSSEDAVLRFSFIGYLTEEIEVGGQTNINVTLVEDIHALDEVVVIGYGEQTKKTLTGSITKVDNEELMSTPVTNISSALTGKVSGLLSINPSGQPGEDGTTMRIRGIGTTDAGAGPLYVIDGVPERGGFDRLDPNDIESISVLKDASAAIYGSRAANGVIIVTTKRGSKGEPKFNFSANQGWTQPTVKANLASSDQLARFTNEMGKTNYSEEQIDSMQRNLAPDRHLANTDWWDATVKKWSPTNRYNLSVSGGVDNVKYYISGGLLNQEGVFKNSAANFSQQNFRSNIDVKLNDYINVNFNVGGTFEQQEEPSVFSQHITWWTVHRSYPWLPVKYSGDRYFSGMDQGRNPAYMGSDIGGVEESNNNMFVSTFNWDISTPWVEGLSFEGHASYDREFSRGRGVKHPFYAYQYQAGNDTILKERSPTVDDVEVSESYGFENRWTVFTKINYKQSFGNHNITAFAGMEVSELYGEAAGTGRRAFPSPEKPYLNFGDPETQTNYSEAWDAARLNYLGRFSYNYRTKYLLDINLRYDGSTNFPSGSRFGLFPGVSAAWRLSSEDFFSSAAPFVDNLKIRASWGSLGRDDVGAYQYIRTYNQTKGNNNGLRNFDFTMYEGNVPIKGFYLGPEPNVNITWEVAQTYNTGLELSMYDRLIEFDMDLFYSRRSNILIPSDRVVADYTGLDLPDENQGIMENRGIELRLGHINQIGDFKYQISANYSFARNKMIEIQEPEGVLEYQKQTGMPLESDLFYLTDGLYTVEDSINEVPNYGYGDIPGEIKFVDYNNDSVINGDDRVRKNMPTLFPEINFGFNINMSYKAVYLIAQFQGAENIYKYLTIEDFLIDGRGNYFERYISDRYQRETQTGKYPVAGMRLTPTDAKNTFMTLDAGYLRCRSIEVGVNIPNTWLNRVGVDGLRVYVNASNPFFIYNKLELTDPEMSQERLGFYPQQRIMNIGANLTF